MKIFLNQSFLHLIRRNRLPAFVFLGSLLFTLGGWQYALHLDKLQAEHKFKKLAQEYQQDLRVRINTYLQALVDLRGLFDSSQYVGRAEFDGFMHSIQLMQSFPGIRRIGYAPLVKANEKSAFEARAQNEGFANYLIKSSGKTEAYFPVLYAYPLTPQVQTVILGMNMAALPNREAAMWRARDANRPVVTKKISMPSDHQHSSAIGIYLPVYRHGALIRTVAERRNALKGYVFEGFRVEDLLRGAFGQDFINNIGLKIYDGAYPSSAALLYQATDTNGSSLHRDILHAKYVTTINVADNTWTLAFSSGPAFFQANRTSTPAVILFCGLLITLSLTGIAAQINVRRRLAWSKEEQNQRFRSLFKQHPDAVYAFDLQGHFIDANEATATLAGLSREALLTKSFKEIIAPECRATSSYRFDQARKGIPQNGETDILTPSGKRLTLNISTLPIVVDEKITGVFGIAKDITKQKQAEEALRESEARFRAIFEQAPVGINQLSLDGQWLFANQKLLDIVGYTLDELKSKNVYFDLTHPEDREHKLAYERRVMSGELDSYDIEQRYIRKDGAVVWVHVTRTTILSADGKLQFLIGIVEDITERKRSEAQIRKQQQLLSTIVDSLPLNLFIRDKQERFVLINNYGAATLGKAKEDVLGKTLADVFPEHVVAKIREHDAIAWKTQQPSFIEERIQQLGEEKYVMAGKLPLHLENEPALLLGYSIDITERKRAEDALQIAHDELEDKVRERTEELHNAYQTLRNLSSHLQIAREEERTRIAREVHDEMGGALTAIKIDISMLKQRLEAQGQTAPGELSRSLKMIDTAVASLRRIITDLRPSILDTMGLWAALEWQLQEFQQRTGVACTFQMEGAETELDDARATAVFRIFQEALTNVARHAQASRLDVSGAANEDGIVINIKDNGIGIKEERRVKSRSFGILGMQERARTFDGSVQINGAPAKGTTVTIKFPLMEKIADFPKIEAD